MKSPALLLFSLLLIGLPASAMQLADVQLPSRILAADGTELVLNGAGIRKKLFFKIYVGALYLAEKNNDAGRIVADSRTKRVLMHFLYESLSADKLQDAWNDGFAANLSDKQLSGLQARIDAFNALFGPVREGDEIRIDYLPGEGTQVWYGDTLKGSVPGEDFHRAVMRIWLGDEPADEDLKQGMLGR